MSSVASAQFYDDIIVTSPNGIWTDARAYATLNAAITAIGTDERTIVIPSEQVVTALTVPATVTLRFERDGSIANSGQLTIQTTKISAESRQIFTGTGDIDFARGTVVKSTWFSTIVEAFDVTLDDELTIIIADAAIVGSDCAVGNDVSLKWEAPGNELIISSGAVTLSNIRRIEAGNYLLFAGAGDFDFLDGTRLKLDWFRRLRSVLTWVEDEEVTIVVSGTHTVTLTDTVAINEVLDFVSERGQFSINGGVVLTIHSPESLITNSVQLIFTGLGTIAFTESGVMYSDWWNRNDVPGTTEMYDAFLTAEAACATGGTIKLNGSTYLISTNLALGDDIFLDATTNNALLSIANIITLTINSPENIIASKRQQIFTGAGSITFTLGGTRYAEWWGVDGTADDVQINAALASASIGTVGLLGNKTYTTSGTINLITDRLFLIGDGQLSSVINFKPAGNIPAIHLKAAAAVPIVQNKLIGFTIDGTGNTQTKVGIRLTDVDVCQLEDISIANFTSAGVDCIGLQTRGRDLTSVKNLTIVTDIPISIEDNPNSTIDIDHFNFNNLYIVGTDITTNPLIIVADGVNLTDVSFDGYQAWAKGTHGFYWTDTTTVGASYDLSFRNVRLEQSTSNAAYMFYISHNSSLQNLNFQNIRGGTGTNGYYLRNVHTVNIKNSYYTNIESLIALNIDVSVRTLVIDNCFWQTGTTFTSSGQTLVSGDMTIYGAIPPSAHYNDTTTVPLPHFITDAPISSTILTLADFGKAEIAQDGFVGFAFIASSSSYPAIYSINGLNASVTEVSDPGTLYTDTEDAGASTNIYWDAGNARYEINNEEGASRDYYINLIGRTR